MEKPILSPNFTIEDIHKLREYNYEMTKDMTDKERMGVCQVKYVSFFNYFWWPGNLATFFEQIFI